MKDNRNTTSRRRTIFRPETTVVIIKKRVESENLDSIRTDNRVTDDYPDNYGDMGKPIDLDTGIFVIDSVCRRCNHPRRLRTRHKVRQDVVLHCFPGPPQREDSGTSGGTGRLDDVIPGQRVQRLSVSVKRTPVSPTVHVPRVINLNNRGIRNTASLNFDGKRIARTTVVY